MGKVCQHCGREAKNSDRFCIFCGKPFLSDLSNSGGRSKAERRGQKEEKPKEEKKPKVEVKSDKKKDEKEEFIPFAVKDVPSDDEEEEKSEEKSKGKSKKKKGKKKKVPFSEEEEDLTEEMDLDHEVQEQLEIKMKIAILGHKKDKLKAKLKGIMKEVKDERYEFDIDYAKEVNIKLNAVKQIQQEIQKREDELKDQLGIFRFDELDNILEERRAQLTELKRQYKLGKIKGSVFEQLKREYAADYRKAQEERQELQKQIKIWISKLKSEKNRETVKLKTIEARYKTKEIDKERYEREKQEISKVIEQSEQQIAVLRVFTKEPAFKLF